jgi:hypothetical protein
VRQPEQKRALQAKRLGNEFDSVFGNNSFCGRAIREPNQSTLQEETFTMFKQSLIAISAMCLLGAAQISQAADNNPLDPNYQAKMSKLRGGYFDLLKNLDKNHDGLISEDEYCAVAGDDPLSPAYKKRQAEFRQMAGVMDANKDGNLCLEEYMAEANPLHPGHRN